MRRFVLLFLIACSFAGTSSAAPSARWTAVTPDSDWDGQRVDLASARRKGNIVKAWILTSREQWSDKSNSDKALIEYDCVEQRLRSLSFISYSEREGNGKVLTSVTNTTEWRAIVPESIGEKTAEFVCAKVK